MEVLSSPAHHRHTSQAIRRRCSTTSLATPHPPRAGATRRQIDELTTTIKIHATTRQRLKLLAVKGNQTMMQLIDRLVEQEEKQIDPARWANDYKRTVDQDARNQEENKTMNTSTNHTHVRQILHDGQPAIIVTHTIHHYHQRTITDALGTRKEGDLAGEEVASREYLKFPSPRPVELFGNPVVGQWSDKKFNHHRGTIENNLDPATHIDYEAWVSAYHDVYSES